MKIRSHTRLPVACLSLALFYPFLSDSAFAASYYWDNDGDTPGFGLAAGTWAVPTIGNATQGWSEDSAGTTEPVNVTTTSSDELYFGTATGLGSGSVTVSGNVDANRLTFGSGSGEITVSGGTIALGGTSPRITLNNTGNTISSALTLDANTSVLMGTNAALLLKLDGPIGGTGNLTFTTPATNFNNVDQVINLGVAGSYTGNTLITTGQSANRLRVRNTSGADDVLPATTVLTLDGGVGSGSGRNLFFDMNGANQTLAGLNSVTRTARNQRVLNNGGAPAILTVNNIEDCAFGGAATHTFQSILRTTRARIEGDISLVKSGAGTLTLAESHTYTGPTTITEGKLQGKLPGSCLNSDMIIADAGATFGVFVSDNTKSWTCASLTTSGAGTLEFDFGTVTPSTTVSPMMITGAADFSAATPLVSIVADTGLVPGTYPLVTWDSLSGSAPTTTELTISNALPATVADLSVIGNTLNLVVISTASEIVKADNTDDLNLGSSWVGGVAPIAGDNAKWDNTVTSANSTILGADIAWGAIRIEDPADSVTIGGASNLTLSAAASEIDMSTATADLTLNCPVAMGDDNVWDVNTGQMLTLGGAVSGDFSLTLQGGGTVQLGTSDVLPDGSGNGNVIVDGNLDLNGNSETVNGLSGNGIIDNLAVGTVSTLTVGQNGQSSTFNGILQNSEGSLNLTKVDTGTLVLGGANTMDGSVAVTGGTLAFTNIEPLYYVTDIAMSGGTRLRPDVVDGSIDVPITIGEVGTTVTITAPSIAGAGGTNPVPLTLSGAISGAGNLELRGIQTMNSYGTIILNAASDYEGSTLITTTNSANTEIFVRLGIKNALPVTTVLTLDGGDGVNSDRYCQLDLYGFSQTLAGLTNNPAVNGFRKQQIINSGSEEVTLTINNSEDYEFSAKLGTTSGNTGSVGSNFGLTKSGFGTFTLSGTNAYTGATTITAGTLALGATDVLADTTAVSVGDATLAIGAGSTDTVDTLDVTGSATVRLGDASSALVFADSSGLAWAGSLNITGTFVSGASLKFGNDANGLTPTQIASISGPGLSDIALDASGYLTATVAANAYNTWASINAGGQTAEEDFDGDGVQNGVEFFMNAPAGFTANPALDGTNTITWANGGNIPASEYGTQFVVQTSTNLVDWTNVDVGDVTNSETELSYTLTGSAPQFVRLKVTPN